LIFREEAELVAEEGRNSIDPVLRKKSFSTSGYHMGISERP
jgi:hypothetical protein